MRFAPTVFPACRTPEWCFSSGFPVFLYESFLLRGEPLLQTLLVCRVPCESEGPGNEGRGELTAHTWRDDCEIFSELAAFFKEGSVADCT